jgi:rhodanese-related sulfurtransferase
MITKGIHQLCAEAEEQIETMTVEQVMEVQNDEDVVLVDIRDVRELWRDGTIPGAQHMPRGMLEFWVDPESPYHREIFTTGKKFIFYCAGGLRSALAAKAVNDMGLAPVAHMRGGYGAWVKAEGPTIEKEAKLPEKKAE